MYKVGLYTLGCKVSQYETQAIAEAFEAEGFEVRSFDEPCDVYVINTCTVTAESDRKSRQIIRRAVRTNPDAQVMVTGCYSQRSPDEVLSIDGVSTVIGTADKLLLVSYAKEKLSSKSREKTVSVTDLSCAEFEKMRISKAPRTRAYVKIEDGCECRCTYCAIADARGRVRSKHPDDVVEEVKALSRGGTREVVLTGIETGSYGKDLSLGVDLADLILRLDAEGACERIRLGSLAPELVGEKFVNKVKNARILVPHFHISMQSGSDNVLRMMKRRYSSDMAFANIERIRAAIPQATFTTDLMVGFPGESEEDFLETVEFVRRARFLDAHVFAYSRRKDTPAATYPGQITEEVKRERSARLSSVVREVRDSVLEGIVKEGVALPCIFETYDNGHLIAHSDTYAEVVAEGGEELLSELKLVMPKYHKDGKIYGEIV